MFPSVKEITWVTFCMDDNTWGNSNRAQLIFVLEYWNRDKAEDSHVSRDQGSSVFCLSSFLWLFFHMVNVVI